MQIVSTGLLQQSGPLDLCSAWMAGFHAAVSAVYLSLKPSMHTIINQVLVDCLPSSPLNTTSLLRTSTAVEPTADNVTLLARFQSKSDQSVLATTGPAEQRHSPRSCSVWHPSRMIKTAWTEAPKHNSVVPLPLHDNGNSSVQISSPEATAQLLDCSVSGNTLSETTKALERCCSLIHMTALHVSLWERSQWGPDQHDIVLPIL